MLHDGSTSYTTPRAPSYAKSNALNPLHHDGRGGAPAVTDGRDAVFARLELMQQRGQDARAGAAERVAERDGAAEEVDLCVFEAEDLRSRKRGTSAIEFSYEDLFDLEA